MSLQLPGQGTLRNVKSPFTKIIATHYYDGPTQGFVEHVDWIEACVFQLLDWDRETDLRVYEIARMAGTSFDEVVAELFEDKRPTWPIWVLQGPSKGRGEQLVDVGFQRGRAVATITTTGLFDDIALWDAAQDAPVSSGLVVPARRRVDVG
jgi:hypothetical protein